MFAFGRLSNIQVSSSSLFGETNNADSDPLDHKPFSSTSPFDSQTGGSGFGGTSSGMIGSSEFGQKSAYGDFGSNTQTSPFGSTSQPSQPAFGTGSFGSPTPFFVASCPVFGTSYTSAFATSSPAFGVATTPALGASNNPVTGSGGGFGASSAPVSGSSSAPGSASGQKVFAIGNIQFGTSTPLFNSQTSPFGNHSGSRFVPYSVTATAETGSIFEPKKLRVNIGHACI